MKPAPLALLTLALAVAVAWPLSHLGAAFASAHPSAQTQPAACAQERENPALPAPRAFALPPGHPPIGIEGLLPPGHPPIGSMPGALPPGHPELPPGHPPIPDGMPLPFGEPLLLDT